MDIMRVAGIAAASALTALVIRRMRPEFGAVMALTTGALLFFIALPGIAQIIDGITAFTQLGGVSAGTTATLLKITGVSLLADFAARTCRDAGEDSIAAHTELAGRILILTLALPSMRQLMDLILSVAV